MDSNLKTKIISFINEYEGGESDHSWDSGGLTNFGITQSLVDTIAKSNPDRYKTLTTALDWNGSVKSLTTDKASEFYYQTFWQECNGSNIFSIDANLALIVFNFSVNMGSKNSCKALQKALNLLNQNGKLYTTITADGILGVQSIQSIKSALNNKYVGKTQLLFQYMSYLAKYYISITENDIDNKSVSIKGWNNRLMKAFNLNFNKGS